MAWRDDSTATNVSLLSKWVYAAVRPLVRILQSAGVSQAVLLDCVKRAYAEHEKDKPKGRLGSGSRYQSVIAMGAVIGAWARSPEWTDQSGQARDLSVRSDDPKGFAALVRAVDAQLDPSATLKELQRMKVVTPVVNATQVRLLRHTLGHVGDETFSVEPVLRDLQRFTETLEYNVFHKADSDVRRLQLTASRISIDPARFADFARFAARNGQVFLDSADDRLNSYAAVPGDAGAHYGVSIFVFFEGPAAASGSSF
jgi:hypothetical protein